jgi:hypothetical protein
MKPTLGQYYKKYDDYETMSLAPVFKPQDWFNLVDRANTSYDCYSFPVGRAFPVW